MPVRVLFLSPGFPTEMGWFTRALASVGGEVIGLGDQPADELPAEVRAALVHHVHVPRLTDTDGIVAQVRSLASQVRIDRVECLWEPYVILAAQLRESLGLPGTSVQQAVAFRDKERMKQVLDAAGIRTPHHYSATTANRVREAAERIGFPVIVKPIAGAGSNDTYRVDSAEELELTLERVRHVPEVSVEEFVDGEELTYDTVCAGGEVLFENLCWYRPRPLQTKLHEWISPVTISLRDREVDELQPGRQLGRAVLQALGFEAGFTHMEWYRTASGEAVFGEIGARPPGGRTVDVMNYATDDDLFVAWASAIVHGRLPHPIEHRYNAASVFKRAHGAGRITSIEGLGRLMAEHGEHVVALDLLPIGAPRRDWRQVLIGDGMVVVRHPELGALVEIADRFASELHLVAS